MATDSTHDVFMDTWNDVSDETSGDLKIALFTKHGGSTDVSSAKSIISEKINAVFAGTSKRWKNIATSMTMASYAAARDMAQTVLKELTKTDKYIISENECGHSLQWMRGQNITGNQYLPDKLHKKLMKSRKKRRHPYALRAPWYTELGHGEAFHMQWSAFTGNSHKGTASVLTDIEIKSSGDATSGMSYSVVIEGGDNLKYFNYIQYGTSKMVGRGDLSERVLKDLGYINDAGVPTVKMSDDFLKIVESYAEHLRRWTSSARGQSYITGGKAGMKEYDVAQGRRGG